MNQRMQIFRLLADGPGTSAEVAAETGLSLRQASAVLSTLHRQGRVTRSEYAREWARGSRAYVYSRRRA